MKKYKIFAKLSQEVEVTFSAENSEQASKIAVKKIHEIMDLTSLVNDGKTLSKNALFRRLEEVE